MIYIPVLAHDSQRPSNNLHRQQPKLALCPPHESRMQPSTKLRHLSPPNDVLELAFRFYHIFVSVPNLCNNFLPHSASSSSYFIARRFLFSFLKILYTEKIPNEPPPLLSPLPRNVKSLFFCRCGAFLENLFLSACLWKCKQKGILGKGLDYFDSRF